LRRFVDLIEGTIEEQELCLQWCLLFVLLVKTEAPCARPSSLAVVAAVPSSSGFRLAVLPKASPKRLPSSSRPPPRDRSSVRYARAPAISPSLSSTCHTYIKRERARHAVHPFGAIEKGLSTEN